MLWLPKLILALAALCFVSGTNNYDGYLLYEVTPALEEQVDLLYKLGQSDGSIDLLSLARTGNHSARVLVAPEKDKEFLETIERNHMPYKVLSRNVLESLEEDFRQNKLMRILGGRASGSATLTNDRYYSFDEIINFIESLAVEYPSRVFVQTVGKSYEGRWMKTITITNGDMRPNKNVIFVDGGIHAREWISPAAVVYLIGELAHNYAENADLLLDYDWVILPVANPDGYEYTQTTTTNRLWRKTRQPYMVKDRTCYGADPNRNFGFHWNEEGASSDPCSDIFAGPTAFSEPETMVLRDLLKTYKNRGKMYLTLHSYGNYLLYPWGWTSELPETADDLHEVAMAGYDAIYDATGTVYQVGSSTNVLYIAAGASDDYAFSLGYPISITMELPAGGLFGFNPPERNIDSMVKETWIGIAAMARKVVTKYPLVH